MKSDKLHSKFNREKLIAFFILAINNQKMKLIISFIIASNRKWSLGTNLTKIQNLYSETTNIVERN